MWRQLIGGGTDEAAKTPEKAVETEERMGSAPPPATDAAAPTDSPGILGARFNYIGRITSKFMEQVAAEDDEEEEEQQDNEMDSEDGWEDGIEDAEDEEEEEEDGWNDADEEHDGNGDDANVNVNVSNMEASDITSTSVDEDFLSATQDHREVTGKLDNVLQEIEEQELQAAATFPSLGEEVEEDGDSHSDQEHQELAVQEIRNEIGQLIEPPPSGAEDGEQTKSQALQIATPNDHLVDHTPAEMDAELETDPSIIALATLEDMTRNTNDDYMEGDHEEDYGPVVDQTPPAFSNVSSLAPRVASDADSICDDETDAAGVGGWGDEKQDQEELDVVDHTPSEIVHSPDKRRDVGSVEVLASVAENSMTGGDNFGLVVDQTPVTPATRWVRSESVIVQANDDLGTVDETTVARDEEEDEDTLRDDGVQSDDEDHLVDYIPSRADSRYGDGSTFAAADPSEVLSVVDGLAPDDQNFGPVVDVTPPPLLGRPAGGEGSTVAFASPSVAVDDSDAEEDGPPGENGAWEGTENGEAPNPQSGNDDALDNTQLVDFLPPIHETRSSVALRAEEQSDFTVGGQSLTLQGENPREDDFGPVVDQIPSGRHASQVSLASTATQLTYSEYQAIEKDDQLHGKPDESNSVLSHEKVVVDNLPPMETKRPVDSTITIGRSLQSEEEEGEEEDTTQFGPVVDHLPTSRASLAPSRGGSTVDALGAVSEANSDEEEEEVEVAGWDEDVSLGVVSDTTERQTVSRSKPLPINDGDRSVSVRFDASADGGDPVHGNSQWRSVAPTNVVEKNGEAEARLPSDQLMNDSSSNGYHDARETIKDSKSFAEADTPPSTPYRRSSDPTITPVTDTLDMPPLLGNDLHQRLHDSNESGGNSYDCITDILSSDPNGGKAFVTGRVRLIDGSEVEIDVRKLLHDEATKRKLAEEQIKALEAVQQSSGDDVVGLTDKNEAMTRRLRDIEQDRLHLHETNLTLKRQLVESQQFARNTEVERDEVLSNKAAMIAEINELKAIMEKNTAVSATDDKIHTRLVELQSKLAIKSGECEKLALKVIQLENRLRSAEETSSRQAKETAELSRLMKETVDSLRKELSGSDDLLTRTERARLVLDEKLRALESEVTNLRASGKLVAEIQIRHERDLQEQYKLLDRKTADLETLDCLVVSLQQEKSKLVDDLSQQRALAEHSEALANELLSVAMERDLLEKSLSESRATMSKLQKFIEDQETEKAEVDSQREKEWSELREELSVVSLSLKEAKTEAQGHVEHIHELEHQLASSRREYAELAAAKEAAESDKASLEAQCKEIDAKYADALGVFQQKAAEHEQKFQLELGELDETCKELKGEIERFREAENLHAFALDEVKSNALREAQKYEESIQNLALECDHMKAELSRLDGLEQKHNAAVLALRNQSASEIAQLQSRLENQTRAQGQSRESFEELQTEMTAMKNDHDEEIARLNMDCDRLRSELSMYQDAQDQLAIASTEQEKLRTELRQQSEAHEMEAVRLQLQCDRLQAEVSMYTESKQEDIESFKSLEAKLQDCYTQHELTLKQKGAECEVLRQRLSSIEAESTVRENQLLEAKAERNAFVEENEELLVQLGLLKEQMDSIATSNVVVDSMKDELSKVQAELAFVRASRDALSEQIGSLGVTLKALESEKVKATNTIDHLSESSEALQSQLDELMASGEKSEEFHKRMLAAEEEAAEKSRALTEAHNASSALQKLYEEAQKSLEIKVRTIEDFTQRLDDNATVQTRLEDTLAQLAEYEQQLRAKDASLEAKNEIVVQLTKSERQIQDLETKLRERNLEIRAMEDKLEAIAEAERTPQIDTAQLGSLKEEVEALNNALQATRSRLSTKERDFDELRSQVVELREARFRQSPVLQENRSISLGNAADVHETISRAMKLKRPDHVRAEALKRLEEERAKNADALAALKASVERYYS